MTSSPRRTWRRNRRPTTGTADGPGSLGLSNSEVRIVSYDDRWPEAFRTEANRIAAVCRPQAREIVHVGSTAVPGLAAKPIIDMLIGVDSLALEPHLRPALESLGYVCMGNYGIEGRIFYRGCRSSTHHLHVAERGAPFWNDEILFRDILRSDPELASKYEALKFQLARCHPHDRPRYTAGKTKFILSALASARGKATRRPPEL